MPDILDQKELPLPTKDFEEDGYDQLQQLAQVIAEGEAEKEVKVEQENGLF